MFESYILVSCSSCEHIFKVIFPKSCKNSNRYCTFLFLGRLGRQGRIVGVPKHNPSVYSVLYLECITLHLLYAFDGIFCSERMNVTIIKKNSVINFKIRLEFLEHIVTFLSWNDTVCPKVFIKLRNKVSLYVLS